VGRAKTPSDPVEPLFRPSLEERERRRRVRRALSDAGFKWEPWQKPERDMVFGMIRNEGDMQTHVRYYRGGFLKAERELAHHYLEHVFSPRESAHETIAAILAEHDIEDVEVREKEIARRHRGPMPPTRTHWKPLAMAAGAALAGYVLRRRGVFKRR